MSASSFARVPPVRRSVVRTFIAMMARDLRVLRRNFIPNSINVAIPPLLTTFVFSYVLPQTSAVGGGGSATTTFSTILLPGLVASSIMTQGMTGTLHPLIQELSFQRSISERAMAPLSIQMLAAQKIVTGALQGLIAGLLVFPAVFLISAPGQAPRLHVDSWPMLVFVMLGTALLSSSGGLLLGTLVDPTHLQTLMAVFVLPMMTLGCVYFPWMALENIRWLQLAILVNPLVYSSEGLRAALTPQVASMPFSVLSCALIGGPIVLGWLGARKFTARVLS